MKQNCPVKRKYHAGFTLIEILVAMGVLAIILVMLMQMQGVAFRACKQGIARVDSFTQARVVLGLIERDIRSIVLRRDLAAFVDQNGEPACAFYTEFPAPSSDRKLSLVEYKFTPAIVSTPPTSGSTGLLRYDYGGNYPGAGVPPTPMDFGNLLKLTNLASATPQPLGENVVGFGIQFLRGDGQYQPKYQFGYSSLSVANNTPVVLISIAVLDSVSYQLAQKNGTLATVTDALNGTPTGNESYAKFWNTSIATSGSGTPIPQPIRSGLHIFERRISIPIFQVQ